MPFPEGADNSMNKYDNPSFGGGLDRPGRTPEIDRVVLSEDNKPGSLIEAVYPAPVVHVVGGSQQKRAKIVTETVMPRLLSGRSAIALDITGVREADMLNASAEANGIGMSGWFVSPSGIIHRAPGDDPDKRRIEAATMLVDSSSAKPPNEMTDREGKITVTNDILAALGDDHPDLDGFDAAVQFATTLQKPTPGNQRYTLTKPQQAAIHDFFGTTIQREEDLPLARAVQRHGRILLARDSRQEPVRVNPYREETFKTLIVPGHGINSGPIGRLLTHYVGALLVDRRTDQLVVVGGEGIDPATMQQLDRTTELAGTRSLVSFGEVNETTLATVGNRNGILVSGGGLNGSRAEEVADAMGKRFRTEDSGESKSSSMSGPAGAVSPTAGTDRSRSRALAHNVYPYQLNACGPNEVTVVQGEVTHTGVRIDRRPPPAEPAHAPYEPDHTYQPHLTVVPSSPAESPLFVNRLAAKLTRRR